MESEILQLRHDLHQHPELSNQESDTQARIKEFMNSLEPDSVITLSKTGVAFIFDSGKKGNTIMFRAELDALPIQEESNLPYRSKHANVAHSCGHDGHMAILAGLAKKIASDPPQTGKVVLLFQPAEEMEQGANDVVNDDNFKSIAPDYIFALHNIPGEQKSSILIKSAVFCAASKGVLVRLKGKSSHAAEPENGKSPVYAIEKLIRRLDAIVEDKGDFEDLVLLTIIHINMGERSFGTTPGEAEILITLRSFENRDMNLLTNKVEELVKAVSLEEKLKCSVSFNEVFPAVVNDQKCVDIIKQSAIENDLKAIMNKVPYKWSEDFGYYTEKFKGGFFGLGAGKNHPSLHNPEYDFPDHILDAGVNMFYSIYKNLNFKKNG